MVVSSAALGMFETIDWDAPVDVEACLRRVPEGSTIKGMFIKSLLDDIAAAGLPRPDVPSYRSFKDYPLRDAMELQVLTAGLLFPAETLRIGLRKIGWTAFPTLAQSMIGRVIFAPVGNNFAAALRLASRGYRVSISGSSVTVDKTPEPNSVIVHLQGVFNFVDSYQVGVFEGGAQHYGHTPDVRIRRRAHGDNQLLVRWS